MGEREGAELLHEPVKTEIDEANGPSIRFYVSSRAPKPDVLVTEHVTQPDPEETLPKLAHFLVDKRVHSEPSLLLPVPDWPSWSGASAGPAGATALDWRKWLAAVTRYRQMVLLYWPP